MQRMRHAAAFPLIRHSPRPFVALLSSPIPLAYERMEARERALRRCTFPPRRRRYPSVEA